MGILDGQRLEEASDDKILGMCVNFGARALKWRRRFMGLLPEVQRRRLFEKKGFNSIFEFAFKLAGLSESQVRRALSLDLSFNDKPNLKNLLVNGEVSINKLARIASIATAENEEELAEKVKILPQGALETLARDVKFHYENQNQNASDEPLFECKSVRAHKLDFEISDEVAMELNRLNFQGHDVNKIILELLEERNREIEEKKEELGEEAIAKLEAKKAALKPGEKLKISNYIPVKAKKILKEEYGKKCSIPHCCKPSQDKHHGQRLSLAKVHDPRYTAPMCREHHQLAHLIDLKYMKSAVANGGRAWRRER